MIDFDDIKYLKFGNSKQRVSYNILKKHNIFEILKDFSPILVGTIPLNIDIDTSDLDIICSWNIKDNFIELIKNNFYNKEKFKISEKIIRNELSIISSFYIEKFKIEVFGQKTPVKEQFAYKHMVIEYNILKYRGENFKLKVIDLKKLGYKTEEAFTKLLNVSGDPYIELLKL